MTRAPLSPADTFLFGLANSSLLFTIAYDLTGLDVAFRNGFAIEDGPVEWGTAIMLALAGVVLLRNAWRLGARGAHRAAALTVLYALIMIFGAGEEISWGQRLAEWQSSEFFQVHNAQGQTNIHNLVVGDVKLVNTLFGPVLSGIVLLYLVALPLVYTRLAVIGRLIDALAVPVPAMRHTLLTLAATAVMLAVSLMAKWEVYELVFSVLCVSIFLAPRNAARVT